MSRISQIFGWLGQAETAIRRGLNYAGLPTEKIEDALEAFLSSNNGQKAIEEAAENFGRSLLETISPFRALRKPRSFLALRTRQSTLKFPQPGFYSFDATLERLCITEDRLKRLVSEGEIRAFRENDEMKLKREEIDTLAAKMLEDADLAIRIRGK